MTVEAGPADLRTDDEEDDNEDLEKEIRISTVIVAFSGCCFCTGACVDAYVQPRTVNHCVNGFKGTDFIQDF